MSLNIKNVRNLPAGSAVLIYDLEAIGDVSDPQNCFIWNISAMVLGDKNKVFDQFVRLPVVNIPEPPHKKLFRVTHDFLRNAGAESSKIVLNYFFKWVHNLFDQENGILLLVSHGNFRFDQPLLQTEIIRNNISVSSNIFFLDSLHWFRSIQKKKRSYSLSSLYKDHFGKPIKNAHLSLFDVHALHDLINAQNEPLSGIAYQIFHTSLLRIPSVGLFTERVLFDKEMLSVEHLVFKFRNNCQSNPQNFKLFLLQECHLDPSCIDIVCSFIENIFIY